MLAVDGIPTNEDLRAVLPEPGRLKQGPVAVIECFQQIPCNPCAEACPRGAITMPGSISERPLSLCHALPRPGDLCHRL